MGQIGSIVSSLYHNKCLPSEVINEAAFKPPCPCNCKYAVLYMI